MNLALLVSLPSSSTTPVTSRQKKEGPFFQKSGGRCRKHILTNRKTKREKVFPKSGREYKKFNIHSTEPVGVAGVNVGPCPSVRAGDMFRSTSFNIENEQSKADKWSQVCLSSSQARVWTSAPFTSHPFDAGRVAPRPCLAHRCQQTIAQSPQSSS